MKVKKSFLGLILVSTMVLLSFTNVLAELAGPSGGYKGSQFIGIQVVDNTFILKELRIQSGKYIDSIELVYENTVTKELTSKRFGGNGGTLKTFKFNSGEYIVEVSGKYGAFVDSLNIVTNHGRRERWGGKGGKQNYSYSRLPGMKIDGFWGRAGNLINAIGVMYNPVQK